MIVFHACWYEELEVAAEVPLLLYLTSCTYIHVVCITILQDHTFQVDIFSKKLKL